MVSPRRAWLMGARLAWLEREYDVRVRSTPSSPDNELLWVAVEECRKQYAEIGG